MLNRHPDSRGPNVGWLFADLLLALAVIFLVANATGSIANPPQPILKPTPTATPPPVPPPPPSTKYYYQFPLTFDDFALESGNKDTAAKVRGDIKAQLARYASCDVVLVLVFGGTPSLDNATADTRAINAANAIIDELKALGKGTPGFVFTHAQYHSPFLINSQFGTAVVQVYFFDSSLACEPPATR